MAAEGVVQNAQEFRTSSCRGSVSRETEPLFLRADGKPACGTTGAQRKCDSPSSTLPKRGTVAQARLYEIPCAEATGVDFRLKKGPAHCQPKEHMTTRAWL